MGNVYIDTTVEIDVDEYAYDMDDDTIINEFFHRLRHGSTAFDEKAREHMKNAEFFEVAYNLEEAKYLFERKQYGDMMIHLERYLGWKGLDKLKVE